MEKRSEGLQAPKSIVWLSIKDFEFLCFDLARELMEYGEPIPDYSTKDNNLLEASLGSPRQTHNGELLYPTLAKQTAILFYSLIKNHPFKNGNKRISVMAMLAFLGLNKKWIDIAPYELYKLACVVSESEASKSNQVKDYLDKTITDHLVERPEI